MSEHRAKGRVMLQIFLKSSKSASTNSLQKGTGSLIIPNILLHRVLRNGINRKKWNYV